MSSALHELPHPGPYLKLAQRKPLVFTWPEIKYGYRPGRSLVLSLLLHCLCPALIVLLGRHAYLQTPVLVPPSLETKDSHIALVLPTLGGGAEGGGREGGGQGNADEISSGLRARSRRGFAYPGPQPIVSDPPKATLGTQTILQPSLENLPHLRRLVELPNIVQPTPPEATPQKPVLVVKSEGLRVESTAQEQLAAPKVTLPLAHTGKLSGFIPSTAALPTRAIPDPVEASAISRLDSQKKGLLVLNAVPPPPDATGRIPQAEARSLFAVSPAEVTVIADPGAGTRAGGSPMTAAGTGDRSDLSSGDALAEAASGGDSLEHSKGSAGTGSGGHYGSSQGAGLNSDAGSGGSGRGSASGSGLGTGTSAATGSGSGVGSAPGSGGFRGITIQGGRYGNSGNMLAKPDSRPQTSYNMTIVSTAGSGGLPDFGVFRNEKVYTVYLDMRSTPDDPKTPVWTLQYALLQPPPASGDVPARIQGTPTPPYATLKQVPQFAPEMLQRFASRLIVASAVLDQEGKLENVSVKQSAENPLVIPLVEALKNWVFEPAKIDGQPVALKVLLGIRLLH